MGKKKQYVSDNIQLMKEWNWNKNIDFNPAQITIGSKEKVWWKCSKDHEWQASAGHRKNGRGCPYCAGRYAIKGYNDLQTVNPELAREWYYDKNEGLLPEDVLPNSDKKVWWRCDKDHKWQASVASRNKNHGCPYCSGRYAIVGETDLRTLKPYLAVEWNYEKNGDLQPENFTVSSGKKVWWKCNKGHEWQATINHRNSGRGCPICVSEQKTSFPEYILAFYLEKHGIAIMHTYKEYGYELDIYIPSRRIAIEYDGYLWHKDSNQKDLEKNRKCLEDGIHLYRVREGLLPLHDSSIDYVVQKGQRDLEQILEKLLTDIVGKCVDVDLRRDYIAIENLREQKEKENSIMLSNPEVALEWNYIKNGNMKPENFAANSPKRVWWKCSKGHEWQATISSRNKNHGCPYCSGRYPIVGESDLKTVNPQLAKEWNYEKNIEAKPENYTASSGKKVWWICKEGHEWDATIASRNSGVGCPYCSSNKLLIGYNDLQTVNPKLANEWNYDKNNGLTPTEVFPNSDKRVWWKCDCGHEWQSTVGHRNKGRGCPKCARNHKQGKYLKKN